MVVHIGLRDMIGAAVGNKQGVFFFEAALNVIFNSVASDPPTPAEQEVLDRLRALAEQLAVLHQHERDVDQELAVASYRYYRLSDATKLLAELRECAPSVLEEAAAPVPTVDAGKWLTWYKHKRSFGLSYEQYLKDTEAGSQGSSQKVANKPSPQAPRLQGPRPANVTQAVVWRLQQQVNAEECEAAGAALEDLQVQLAVIRQQQEQVYKQLTEGWRSALRAAFAPTEQPLTLHLTISPDGPALQHMQQQLEDSQAQLAAARQEVAAAWQRAEAAEAALHQQQQQAAAAAAARVVTVQEPAVVLAINIQQHEEHGQHGQQQQQSEGSQLEAVLERLAVLEGSLATQQRQQQQSDAPGADEIAQREAQQLLELPASSGDGGSMAQQPDTPAFRGLAGGQAALPLPLLAPHISPCSSSGSNTTHKSSSRLVSSQAGQPRTFKDAAGLAAPGGCGSAADQQQQQLGTDITAVSGDASAAAAVDQLLQAPAGLALPQQDNSKGCWGQGGSMSRTQSRGTLQASGSPTDAITEQSAGGMGQRQSNREEPQQQGMEAEVEDQTASHRGSSAGSVCGSAHSRRSSTHSNSLAAVLGSNGGGDFWGFGTGERLGAGGSRRESVEGLGAARGSSGGAGLSARLPEPASVAVLASAPGFLSMLAARFSQSANSLGCVVPAVAAPPPAKPGCIAAGAGAAAAGASAVRSVGVSGGRGAASAGVAQEAGVSSDSCSTSSSVGVIGPLSPEKAMPVR